MKPRVTCFLFRGKVDTMLMEEERARLSANQNELGAEVEVQVWMLLDFSMFSIDIDIELIRHTYTLHTFIMSVAPSSAALRCCRHALKLRSSTKSSPCTRLASTLCTSPIRENRRRKTQSQLPGRRWETTDAAAANPKISSIVDQISQLTLLETADLVQSLKVWRDYI